MLFGYPRHTVSHVRRPTQPDASTHLVDEPLVIPHDVVIRAELLQDIAVSGISQLTEGPEQRGAPYTSSVNCRRSRSSMRP